MKDCHPELLGPRIFSQRIADSNRIIHESSLPQKRLNQSLVKRRFSTRCTWYFGKGTNNYQPIRKTLSILTSQAKSIQRLAINYCFPLTKKGSNDFIKYFSGLKALKNLRFRMIDPEISLIRSRNPSDVNNTGFRHLSKALKRFHSLESLDLCFRGSSYVNDESLRVLSKGFRMHRFLKTLALSFADCYHITNLGIQKICKGLKSLIFLENVSLSFAGCKIAANAGLLTVQKALVKLKRLQEVDLDVRSWKGIEGNYVLSMIRYVETLPSFQRITVRYWDYEFVAKQVRLPMRFGCF